MPTNVPELQQTKVNGVSLQLLIGIVVIGFFAGLNFMKMQAQDELQKIQHQFAIDEIQGLRKDMEREVLLLRKDVDLNHELELLRDELAELKKKK